MCPSTAAFAAATTQAFRPGAVIPARQWEVTDIRIEGPANLAAPFDVDASADFEGPGGERMKVPLFYNGGREFLLRFMPPAPGAWKFGTASASVPALNHLAGSVNAAPAAQGRRGPIGISKQSPRRFAYADGSPCFPIAFEVDWLFALDAHNAAGIPKTRTLSDYIAAHGFNQVVMNVYAYDVAWPKDPKLPPGFDYARPKYAPFGGTNDSPDYSTLNAAFFQHLDRVIAYLDSKGLAAHLMIYVWNKKVKWAEAMSAADNRYFDYVVKRYQAWPNIIWNISKEALNSGYTAGYITDRIHRLRSLDAFRRLVTVHDYGYCRQFPSEIDFTSIQVWASELYSRMLKVHADSPSKPVLNIEHVGYERGPYHVFTGDYLSAEVCLERAWQCIFAGAYPTHYWQDTSWSVVIHDPSALAPADQPKLDYYRHMDALVRRLGLHAFEPVPAARGSSGMVLSNGKGRHLVYVPKENSAVHVTLPGTKGRTAKATWINPFTGESREVQGPKMVQWQEFTPPGWPGFSLLLLEELPGQ